MRAKRRGDAPWIEVEMQNSRVTRRTRKSKNVGGEDERMNEIAVRRKQERRCKMNDRENERERERDVVIAL